MNNSSTYCLIMAGGVGSRFWPLSTEENPKQFLDILGTGKSLIQLTFDRFNQMVPEENIYVLTNLNYKNKVVQQLGINSDQVLCEPQRKNTAPCIAYATAKIHKKDSNAVLLVSPADHLIINETQFFKDLNTGIEKAQSSNDLVTFGIKPNRPDTGYGYIEFDASEGSMNSVAKVKQFREKPDLSLAKSFIQQGNFYWNSGMFVWKSTTIMNSFKNHANALYNIFFEDLKSYNTEMEDAFLKEAFTKCEDISIDYAILEKDSNTSIVLSTFDWSDLGTWGSLKDLLEKDENKNSKNNKEIYFFNSKDCLVKTNANKTTIIDGLENYIIIDTDDKLMILKGENEQQLKAYLKIINQN
jgi:mannose-1-phosphate guanylyltransferase